MSISDDIYTARKEHARACISTLEEVSKGLRLQKDFRASLESFGLTKGTWMALQHVPAACAMFRETPSLESLSAVGANPSSLQTCQSVASKYEALSHLLRNMSVGVEEYFNKAKERLSKLADRIDEEADTLEENGDMAHDAYIFDLPIDERVRQARCTALAVAELLKTNVTTIIDNDHTLSEVEENLSQANGMESFNADGQLAPLGICRSELIEKATATSLGYQVYNTIGFAKDLTFLIDKVNTLLSVKGKELIAAVNSVSRDTVEVNLEPVAQPSFTDEADVSQEDAVFDKVDAASRLAADLFVAVDNTTHIATQFLATISLVNL